MKKFISALVLTTGLLSTAPAFAAEVSSQDLISAYSSYLGQGEGPPHTTVYFDQKIHVTERVIDKSIKSLVEKIYASDRNPASKAQSLVQLTKHCITSLVKSGLGQYAAHCDL